MKVNGKELFKMLINGEINGETKCSVDNYRECTLDFIFEDGRNVFKWFDEVFEVVMEDNKISKIDEYVNYLENQNCIKMAKKINEIIDMVNKIEGKKENLSF